jgi:hypothetical protein
MRSLFLQVLVESLLITFENAHLGYLFLKSDQDRHPLNRFILFRRRLMELITTL